MMETHRAVKGDERTEDAVTQENADTESRRVEKSRPRQLAHAEQHTFALVTRSDIDLMHVQFFPRKVFMLTETKPLYLTLGIRKQAPRDTHPLGDTPICP